VLGVVYSILANYFPTMANILREQLVLDLRSARVGCDPNAASTSGSGEKGQASVSRDKAGRSDPVACASAAPRGVTVPIHSVLPQPLDPAAALEVDTSFLAPLPQSTRSCESNATEFI
jgi:hypothetical protein